LAKKKVQEEEAERARLENIRQRDDLIRKQFAKLNKLLLGQ
jgi:hypothetical protein